MQSSEYCPQACGPVREVPGCGIPRSSQVDFLQSTVNNKTKSLICFFLNLFPPQVLRIPLQYLMPLERNGFLHLYNGNSQTTQVSFYSMGEIIAARQASPVYRLLKNERDVGKVSLTVASSVTKCIFFSNGVPKSPLWKAGLLYTLFHV